MDLNFSAFQEPRGVMRILHFIFSICGFATITSYTGFMEYSCKVLKEPFRVEFSYPFNLMYEKTVIDDKTNKSCNLTFYDDFSSDAQFFVATGVLAMLYALFAMVIYAKFDEMYRTNTKLPLYDFVVTVIFGVLWLSSSAAWANGLTGLKYVTDSDDAHKCDTYCSLIIGSFSTLNISVVFGFLNFFLWAADLWFLYKETAWFQGANPPSLSGV